MMTEHFPRLCRKAKSFKVVEETSGTTANSLPLLRLFWIIDNRTTVGTSLKVKILSVDYFPGFNLVCSNLPSLGEEYQIGGRNAISFEVGLIVYPINTNNSNADVCPLRKFKI